MVYPAAVPRKLAVARFVVLWIKKVRYYLSDFLKLYNYIIVCYNQDRVLITPLASNCQETIRRCKNESIRNYVYSKTNIK